MASVLSFGVACGDDDTTTVNVDTSMPMDATTKTVDLELSLNGLEPLGDRSVYEGWLIIDGAPVSTGRFNLNEGETQKTFSNINAEGASLFVLTIEPKENDPAAPSATKVLAGALTNNNASLTASHEAALGDDFTSVDGVFILATPSSAATDDEDQGIWFFDPASDTRLTLPTLPEGWVYEGWVAGDDGPVSTGRFTDVNAADDDGAGAAAGVDPGTFPAVPGQDFVMPARKLGGLKAVISVEPSDDDSPAPFAIKPLLGDIDGSQLAPTLQSLAKNGTLPSGSVVLK